MTSKIYSWVHRYRTTSVTELEIMHGFLLHHDPSNRSFFYFGDPALLNSMKDEVRKRY